MLDLRSDGCSNVKTKCRQAVVFLKGKNLMLLQKDFHEGQLILHIHIVTIYSVLNCSWRVKETISNVLNPKYLTFIPFLFSYLPHLMKQQISWLCKVFLMSILPAMLQKVVTSSKQLSS